MGISQQIGSSSLSKPGVCTSSTRPATPYEGQMIYETDTDKVLVYNGSAWYANWNLPFGIVGFSTSTSNSAALTTSLVTQFTITFTAIANRYYKYSYYEPQALTSNIQAQYIQTVVKNGATILQQAFLGQTAAVSKFNAIELVGVSTFSVGSITLTAQATTSSTSGTPIFYRGATQPGYFMVEDIGVL